MVLEEHGAHGRIPARDGHCQDGVVGRNHYFTSMLASQGMCMLPRKPLPKGTPRVVPIVFADNKGASFFRYVTEMLHSTQAKPER